MGMRMPPKAATVQGELARIRAALVEAGLTDCEMDVYDRDFGPEVGVAYPSGPANDLIVWRAFFVAGSLGICWPCYRDQEQIDGDGCGHDIEWR